MNKVFLVKNVFMDYGCCYYEGDEPNLHEDYKLFGSRTDAEKFIALQPKTRLSIDANWQIEELPIL